MQIELFAAIYFVGLNRRSHSPEIEYILQHFLIPWLSDVERHAAASSASQIKCTKWIYVLFALISRVYRFPKGKSFATKHILFKLVNDVAGRTKPGRAARLVGAIENFVIFSLRMLVGRYQIDFDVSLQTKKPLNSRLLYDSFFFVRGLPLPPSVAAVIVCQFICVRCSCTFHVLSHRRTKSAQL